MSSHRIAALGESDRQGIATAVSIAGAVVGVGSTLASSAFLGLSVQHLVALVGVLGVATVTLVFIRRGAVTPASWFLCVSFSLLLLGLSWIESGVQAASAPAYLLVIGLSALLLGPKEGLGFALVGASAYALLELAAHHHWLPEPAVEPGHGLVFGLIADAVLLGLLMYFAVDRMGRAVANERALAMSLVEAEARLQESAKMEAIGRLAGGVAHEFNNLMTAVYGYADMIARGGESEETRRDAEEIRCSAKRARDLTQYLLTLSQRRVATVELVDPASLVRDQTDIMRKLIGDRVGLTIALDPDTGVVSLDPAELAQCLTNLVVNAAEAMPDGGEIEVGVHATRLRNDGHLPDGDYVEVSVRDRGPGISPEVMRHLFEPFYTTKDQRTGMGLAMAYGAVKQRDGDIRVDTEPSGTKFRILLPRAKAELPEGDRAERPETLAARPAKRILVVDDDPTVLRVVERILRNDGHEVVTVSTAENAEMRALQEHFDVVLSDVVMVGTSGPELCRRLTERGSTAAFILMSGYVRDELGPQGLPDGATFLEKPFSPRSLREAIS